MQPTKLLPLGLLLAFPAAADKIHTVDGRTLSKITITAEKLGGVEYRDEKRKEGRVPADEILAVEYATKPQLVDRADSAIEDEAYIDARDDLESFLQGMEEVPRKHPWSRAYALWRLIEVNGVLGDSQGLAAAADRMLEVEPESRYLPMALLRKSQALYDNGDKDGALKALGELETAVTSKSLGDRWRLEAELHGVLFEASLKGQKRIDELEDLASDAASFPVVMNRARAALGETLLRTALEKTPADKDMMAEAQKTLRGVVEDGKGDRRTLAAAYVGLADCLFSAGEPNAQSEQGIEMLEEAQLLYMRVVVSFKDQLGYVPKAMFYGGRCFQLLSNKDNEDEAAANADKLYLKLLRQFPDSRWASEARGFRPKK